MALHGIPTSSALFEPLLPKLGAFRFIAPDLLGQGATEVPTQGRLDFAAYLAHLRTFLDDVAPETFHLLLHDFGGVLGLTWATEHVERLRSLILLSTTVRPSARIAALYAANIVLGRRILEVGMPYTLRSRRPIDRQRFRAWAAPWRRRRFLRGSDHFGRRHLRSIRERLHRITCPVLVIWGAEDNVFPLSHALQIVQQMPLARLEVLPECGHWSPLDSPNELADLVCDHCQTVEKDDRNGPIPSSPGR